MKRTMNYFINILVLLAPCIVHGIQVYENNTNDITTKTTRLVIVPTQSLKMEVAANDNVTAPMTDMPNQQLIANLSSVPANQEKNSRSKQDDNRKDVPSTNVIKFEQQQKTSSNVKHEKFVPSPEISIGGIETAIPQSKENFFPTNQYYHPVKHSVHFHSSAPIVSSGWQNSQDLNTLPQSFPKFEEEIPNNRENEKLVWSPPSYDKGKWYFMPDKHRVEATEKPKTVNGKWKWVSDDEDDKSDILSNYNSRPFDYDTPIIPSNPPNDFSYAFEIPSTDSTPYSFGAAKYGWLNSQSSTESSGPSTSLNTSDLEWESPYTFSNGKLKHKSKGKGNGVNISPWKKILHVLTAAIPIGLLISALTPQVIYVDPNSTSEIFSSNRQRFHSHRSISPSNSLSLLSTTKVRSLDRSPIQLPESSEIIENQLGRKLMSNPLMDFLHVLRVNGNGMDRTDSCDDRNFCETARNGAEPNASVLNKMLWKIANETPELQARKSGLEHIFHAIRNNNCSIFECKKQEMNYHHQQNYRNY